MRAKVLVVAVPLALMVGCGGGSGTKAAVKPSVSPPLTKLQRYRAAEATYGTTGKGAQDDEVQSVSANLCDNTQTDMTTYVAGLDIAYSSQPDLQIAVTDAALLLNVYCPGERAMLDQAVTGDVLASMVTLPPEADGSAAPTPEPVETTPPPLTYLAGQSVDITLTSTNRLDGSTTDGAATLTVRSFNLTTYSSFGEAPQNGLYVIVSVNYKATSGSVDYNPFNWELQLADGTTYQPFNGNSYAAAADPHLDSGTLSQGQQTTGNLVFDANAPHGELLYKPGADIVATWKY
jgi:hypothetical protein